MTIFFVVIALVVGLVVGFLLERIRLAEANAQNTFLQKENQDLRNNINELRISNENALQLQQQTLEQHSKERMNSLKAEFQSLSQEILEAQAEKLAANGQQQLSNVVQPLREHLNSLNQAIQDANEKRASSKTSFEEAMKRLAEQTKTIGEQTENLTNALKGESKTQGDWGEMILDSILEHSGLRKNQEYVVQENVKTESGRNLRPDVIIHFPDKRNVVIDSKVSLTAYMDYLNATNEAASKSAVEAHLQSVRKHIDELSNKDYSSVVSNTTNFVLLFLQSDAAYILAVKNDNNLNQYAYNKHVIITCPTTLMMTLQIIYNIWQSDNQNKNINSIIKKANALYEKFAGFTESVRCIGKELKQANEAYEKAIKQLTTGRGNIMKSMEDIRGLGLSPKKQLPDDLIDIAENNAENDLPDQV